MHLLKLQSKNHLFQQKNYFWFISSIAFFVIVFSYTIEKGFNLPVCKLCLIQRYLYASLFLVSLIGLIKKPQIALTLCMLVLSFLFVVSTYHSLIQFGLLKDQCISLASKITNMTSFEQTLFESPVPCSNKSLSFMGLPLSTYSAFISLGLISLSFVKKELKP